MDLRLTTCRYATRLAWAVVLLTLPHSLGAQTPCEAKKAYDDAKAIADKADTALARFQKIQKKLPGKLPGDKAKLQADLTKARGDTVTTNQVLKDAEKALTDAKQDSAKFASGDDKGKRLGELPGLIAARKANAATIRKELDGKNAVVTQIDDATKAGAKAELAIKVQMPAIGLTDVDAAKKQVDDDIAQLERALQKNQQASATLANRVSGATSVKAEGNTVSVTTGLSCPQVTALNARITTKGKMLVKAVSDYETVDQNNANAAGLRTEFAKKAQEYENGIVADQAELLTAAQACQQSLKDNLTDLAKKRNELEQLDPGGAIRKRSEELKNLETDTALDTELTRLTGERDVQNRLVADARRNVTNSQTAKAAADAAVEELEKNIDVRIGTDTVGKVKPDYDVAVTNKDAEVKRAGEDLTAAKNFLDDLNAIKPKAAEYKTHKKEWDKRNEDWKKRVEAWKAGKDPGEAKQLRADRDKLAADKTALDQEKGKLAALLKDKKLYKVKICDRKKELRDALANRKSDLDPFKCFTDAATSIGDIDARTKLLAAAPERPQAVLRGVFRLASWTSGSQPRRLDTRSTGRRPKLIESLQCMLADLKLESDLDELDVDLTLDDFDDTAIAEPTDSVPADIAKNTAEVKVARYFVFTLTNASGGLYVGDEDGLKQSVRCGFEGGGINCKPTDLVTYKKLLGPFPTQEEAQAALCKSITETRYFPVGIGLKGRWQGGNTWYGLWNASVSGCPK